MGNGPIFKTNLNMREIMWKKIFNTDGNNEIKDEPPTAMEAETNDFDFDFNEEPATPIGENVIKRQNTINEKVSISSEDYEHDLDLDEDDEEEEIDFDVAILEYGITVQEIRDLKSAPGFISFLAEKEKCLDLVEGVAYRALHETKKQEDRIAFLSIIQDRISKADIKDKEVQIIFMGIINGYIGQTICGRTIWYVKTF